MSEITAYELAVRFGQYMTGRKNSQKHTELQDEYFDNFVRMMKAGGECEENLQRIMMPELIAAYMKTIPNDEREGSQYRTVIFLINQYNRKVKEVNKQLNKK